VQQQKNVKLTVADNGRGLANRIVSSRAPFGSQHSGTGSPLGGGHHQQQTGHGTQYLSASHAAVEAEMDQHAATLF
jgi:hypothetical protein